MTLHERIHKAALAELAQSGSEAPPAKGKRRGKSKKRAKVSRDRAILTLGKDGKFTVVLRCEGVLKGKKS